MGLDRRRRDAASRPALGPASATFDLLFGAERREFKQEGAAVDRRIRRWAAAAHCHNRPPEPARAGGKGA
jgi:hypothetical protein